jgi:predicted porin
MKLKLLAAALAVSCAVPAFAQSSVTIYGIADAGVMYVNNGGTDSKTKLVSGIADGSRLGFKGTEDLGGGYKAIFNLEARVELDNGKQQAGNLSSNQGVALIEGLPPRWWPA